MKKRIAGAILLMVISLLYLTGCDNAQTSEKSIFVDIEHSGMIRVVYHKDTKVMYVMNDHGGIQIMVNADGTPMIYEVEDD